MSGEEQMSHYFCPFCSKEILPQDILFADEDKTASVHNDPDYDPVRAKFEQQVLTLSDVITPEGGKITMELRPVYKYHRWTQPSGENLSFQEPLSISRSSKSPFPQDITILRSNGMTPKQLSGEEKAPWLIVEKEDVEKPKEPEKRESVASRLRKEMLGVPVTKSEVPEINHKLYADMEMTLTEKACPHCHSILPYNFGELETYRVAMLGGTRSGKTTYMVAAANLLKQQNGLPSGLISSCTISTESARYFDFLIKCMEYNKLAATVMDDKILIRFVFPIVMNITSVCEGGGEKEFILIINDIPGEAMTSPDFLMNYPGLRQANAAIMLMDPMQFVSSPTHKETLAKEALKLIHGDGEDPALNDVKAHLTAHFTPHPFGQTLNNVKKMITDSKFPNLSCFTLVLNKLDLLYAGDNSFIDEKIAHDLSHIHGNYQLGAIDPTKTQHDDGMDLELIRGINGQVVYLIEKRLKFTSYTQTLQSIAEITGDIITLCTSVHNWNAAENKFFRPADANGKAEAETLLGFRMLEPLLYTLAKLSLVRTKEPVKIEEEQELGFFQKLGRLFHKK